MCIRDRLNPLQLKDELTSIRQLSPNSSLVKYMSELRGSPNVPVQSIIGDRGRNDTPNSSDGVVKYHSCLLYTSVAGRRAERLDDAQSQSGDAYGQQKYGQQEFQSGGKGVQVAAQFRNGHIHVGNSLGSVNQHDGFLPVLLGERCV